MSGLMGNYADDSMQSAVSSNSSFEGLIEAEVQDNLDEDGEGKIKIFVPKLMYDTSYNEESSILPQSSTNNNVLNKSSLGTHKNDLNQTNYITVRPATLFENGRPNWYDKQVRPNSGQYKVPRIGSHVFVYFVDGDPQNGYYLPFTPTVENDKLSDVFASENYLDPNKKINIETIRSYWNGSRIEVDTNEETNTMTFTVPVKGSLEKCHKITLHDNGTTNGITLTHANEHTIEVIDDQIILTMKDGTSITINTGKNIHIIGNTKIDGNVKINGDIDISGSGNISGDFIIGGISFLGHVHICPACGSPTSPPV